MSVGVRNAPVVRLDSARYVLFWWSCGTLVDYDDNDTIDEVKEETYICRKISLIPCHRL